MQVFQDYIAEKPKQEQPSYHSLLAAVEKKQFEVALRKVASIHECHLVGLILNYVKASAMAFDINALSPTQGMNAFDLAKSSAENSFRQQQTLHLLALFGGKPTVQCEAKQMQ